MRDQTKKHWGKKSGGCCCSSSADSNPRGSTVSTLVEGDTQTLELLIKGAGCGGCVRKIETALLITPGVEQAGMKLDTGIATVVGKVDVKDLLEVIENAGFQVTVNTIAGVQ